jgi:hypothetical protein
MRRAWCRAVTHVVAAAVVACVAGTASAADWAVAQMSGAVTITAQGAQPIALTRGASLPRGGILTTGATGRALLVRDAETMVVGPNAAIAIPHGANDRQFTTILANSGVVEFNVDRRNVRHFSVETPYLAALVKGTEFTVEVTRGGAAVRVTSGTVEVTALATGHFASLRAGQVATVDGNGILALGGSMPRPTVFQGSRRGSLVGATLASLRVGAAVDFASPTAAAGLGLPSVGGVGEVGAGLNPGGVMVDAGPGGVHVETGIANISAGPGGVQVDTPLASVSAGPGGVEVDAPLTSVTAGEGGVQVEVGPIGLGLGAGGLLLGLGN